MKLPKLALHKPSDIGDGDWYYRDVFFRLKPGEYYWSRTTRNTYKVILRLFNFILSIRK